MNKSSAACPFINPNTKGDGFLDINRLSALNSTSFLLSQKSLPITASRINLPDQREGWFDTQCYRLAISLLFACLVWKIIVPLRFLLIGTFLFLFDNHCQSPLLTENKPVYFIYTSKNHSTLSRQLVACHVDLVFVLDGPWQINRLQWSKSFQFLNPLSYPFCLAIFFLCIHNTAINPHCFYYQFIIQLHQQLFAVKLGSI